MRSYAPLIITLGAVVGFMIYAIIFLMVHPS